MPSPRTALVLSVVVAAAAGCGRGGGARTDHPGTSAEPPPVRLAGGFSIRVPKGWHTLGPPVTALSYPTERLLLTSYRAPRGGNCSPGRAEARLPADGVLIFLLEYRPSHGAAWSGISRSAFPPRPARFTLPRSALGTYECWRVPSYLVRFRAADRPFQLHVALGAHVTGTQRARVLRVLDSLRFIPLPPPSRLERGNAVTPARLEYAMRNNPNNEATAANCARLPRRRRFTCTITLPQHAPATFDVVVLPGGCYVAERRRPGLADYGCVPR